MAHYPQHRSGDDARVPASPNLPDVERGTLAFWKSDGTFQASIDQRPAGEDGSNEFVFYDGPPSRTGFRTTDTCSRATSRTSSRATRP
ncbi:hypothetical protein GCM10025864_42840 [Luteimicrobium album]|uniref:Uncharacterized protein n=1 Tax=Luteimicrobium album TaxID=1054550 RepID=A0ABQ6I7L5_9MICO|nr:hypothetical protein GCM10025864_42840 [Luteimicrobium album]